MMNRTLVYMIFRTDCISLRTVNRSRKSPHRFYILRSRLEELEHTSKVIVQDIHSFAVLRWDHTSKTIEIELTWLSGDDYSVSGYKEMLILPYDKMNAFLNKSTLEDRPVVWKTLSVDKSTTPVQALKHCARAPTSPAHSTCLLLLLHKSKSEVWKFLCLTLYI